MDWIIYENCSIRIRWQKRKKQTWIHYLLGFGVVFIKTEWNRGKRHLKITFFIIIYHLQLRISFLQIYSITFVLWHRDKLFEYWWRGNASLFPSLNIRASSIFGFLLELFQLISVCFSPCRFRKLPLSHLLDTFCLRLQKKKSYC